MLRHTGNIPQPEERASSASAPQAPVSKDPPAKKGTSGKKLTPYTLYMQEKYVALKKTYKDDKKAMFLKCHEMWENESLEVKGMYERMAREEFDRADTSPEMFEDNAIHDTSTESSFSVGVDYNMANQALSLESAVQFAGLVAAHHVNVKTRDLTYLDATNLIEQAIVFRSGPQEI